MWRALFCFTAFRPLVGGTAAETFLCLVCAGVAVGTGLLSTGNGMHQTYQHAKAS